VKLTKQALKRIIKEELEAELGAGPETYRVTVDAGEYNHELDFAGASSVVDIGKNKDGKVVLLIDDKVEFILDIGMTIYKLDKIARGTPTEAEKTAAWYQAQEDAAALER